jgi:hypothetical protein
MAPFAEACCDKRPAIQPEQLAALSLISIRWTPVFPRSSGESVCVEIMLK